MANYLKCHWQYWLVFVNKMSRTLSLKLVELPTVWLLVLVCRLKGKYTPFRLNAVWAGTLNRKSTNQVFTPLVDFDMFFFCIQHLSTIKHFDDIQHSKTVKMQCGGNGKNQKKNPSMSEQWFNGISSISKSVNAIECGMLFILSSEIFTLSNFLFFAGFRSYRIQKAMGEKTKCWTIGLTWKQFKIHTNSYMCSLWRFASLVKCAVSRSFKCEIGEFIAWAIGCSKWLWIM